MNHGLITWGATPREAYDRHVEVVTRAEEYVARPSSAASRHLLPARGEKVLANPGQIAPALRGALCRDRKFILEFDDSPEVLEFLARDDASKITQIGPATPDHLL